MIGEILFCDIAIVALSSTFTSTSLYGYGSLAEESLSYELEDLVAEESLDTPTAPDSKDAAVEIPAVQANCPQDSIADVGDVGVCFPVELWKQVKAKLVYFWREKLAFHTVLLGWILYCFTNLLEYPISFSESEEDSDDIGGGSYKTFCNHKLVNLLWLSALDNVVYAVGSILYTLLMLKLHPRAFFLHVMPSIGLLLLLFTACLFFIDKLGQISSFIITSVALVVPYYLEQYIFYFWSAEVDEEKYGFVYSVYNVDRFKRCNSCKKQIQK